MTFSLGNGNARQLSNFQKVFILAENRLDVEYAIITLRFTAVAQHISLQLKLSKGMNLEYFDTDYCNSDKQNGPNNELHFLVILNIIAFFTYFKLLSGKQNLTKPVKCIHFIFCFEITKWKCLSINCCFAAQNRE